MPRISAATVQMMTRYKAWANRITFPLVLALPEGEATRERSTHFKSMAFTLNHIHVIDSIFQAHLENRPHGYTARNTPTCPPLEELWEAVQAMDKWYVDLSDRLSDEALSEMVHFQFVDGGDGAMTRSEIILHVVNHATYHRGFVGDMLNQLSVVPASSDISVFLRDARPSALPA